MHFLRSAGRGHGHVQPLSRKAGSAEGPPAPLPGPRVCGGSGTLPGRPAPQRHTPGPERGVISAALGRQPEEAAEESGPADGKVKWRPGCLQPLQ